MPVVRPDVVVLGAEWPERALLRAQLMEEGLEVVAIDAWPPPHVYRTAATKPRVMLVDLRGLPDPAVVLDEMRVIIDPDCAIVVTALGTLDADDVRKFGYQVVTRPVLVADLVKTVTVVLRRSHAP